MRNIGEINTTTMEKGRVTGFGGIFFKTEDPESTKKWYYDHLRLVPNEYGSLFEFREGANPDKIGYNQWGPFKDDTTYFEPSERIHDQLSGSQHRGAYRGANGERR